MLAGEPARIFSRVAFVVIWTDSCEWTAEADRIRIGRRRAQKRRVKFFIFLECLQGMGSTLYRRIGGELKEKFVEI